jgi:flagellar biogenesis protein FliO
MMRGRLLKGRGGRIVLMCVCALLMSTAGAAADTGEDQPIKGSTTTEAVRFDSGGTSATSTSNPLDISRVLLAMGIVLGAIFLLRWIGQRVLLKNGGLRGNKAIHVVSRSMLSPKQQVIMLRVGKRLIVVGDSGGQMSTLCEISDPDEVAGLVGESVKEPAEGAKSFGSMFKQAEEPFEESPEPPEAVGLDDATTREEINGLLSKVQLMRKRFKGV